MRQIFVICKRELKFYFVSPTAYVVACIFLILSGLFFTNFMTNHRTANFSFLSEYMLLILFLAPILTIRLFAEEKKTGTIELLLTSPISTMELVLGKFIAAFILYSGILLTTLIYVFFMEYYSEVGPDYGILFTAYLGLLLLGASLIGIGTFTSALTSSQMIAAVSSFGISLLFIFIWEFARGSSLFSLVMKELSLLQHYLDFYKGILDSHHVIYYLFWIILSLLFSNKAIESYIWK